MGDVFLQDKLAIQFSDEVLTRTTHEDVFGIHIDEIGSDTLGKNSPSVRNSSSHIENPTTVSRNLNPPTMLMTHRRMTNNYPMTTVRSMPWLQTPASTRGKKKNVKTVGVVIYPKFEQYISKVDDPFWVEIFKQCSYGKLPTGITYRNDVLNVKKGNKIISEEISDDIDEGMEQCIMFFKRHGRIRSELDKKNEKDAIDSCGVNTNNNCISDWKSIKNKALRNKLLIEYIYRLSKERNLNQDEISELKTMINLGFILKIFSPENIILEDGNIKDIKGIKWDYNRRRYYIDGFVGNSSMTKLKEYIHQDQYLKPEHKFKIDEDKDINYMTAFEKVLKPLSKKL